MNDGKTNDGNGHDETSEREPQSMQLSQKRAESLIDARVKQVLGVVIRGLLVSSQGIPPDVVMASTCRIVGNLIGETFSGDLVTILKLRADLKKQFETALNDTPIKPPPAQTPQMTQTTPFMRPQ